MVAHYVAAISGLVPLSFGHNYSLAQAHVIHALFVDARTQQRQIVHAFVVASSQNATKS
jgi:hypothetical protein